MLMMMMMVSAALHISLCQQWYSIAC